MADNGDWCLIESDPGVFTELIRGFGRYSGMKASHFYVIYLGLIHTYLILPYILTFSLLDYLYSFDILINNFCKK